MMPFICSCTATPVAACPYKGQKCVSKPLSAAVPRYQKHSHSTNDTMVPDYRIDNLYPDPQTVLEDRLPASIKRPPTTMPQQRRHRACTPARDPPTPPTPCPSPQRPPPPSQSQGKVPITEQNFVVLVLHAGNPPRLWICPNCPYTDLPG